MESCLVFDEIDAHIGGEAAVSVAKLLKQQGRSRQIIAVTHNPVIAAAADLHIAVVKQQVTSRTHPIAGASASSTISTLSGRSERESELARMATGSLNTTAGVDLARALLDIDFNSL
jgi:DNA repair protein RecN (Recombination protein N)